MKKISEDQSEKRIAYEVSVNKLDLVDEEAELYISQEKPVVDTSKIILQEACNKEKSIKIRLSFIKSIIKLFGAGVNKDILRY